LPLIVRNTAREIPLDFARGRLFAPLENAGLHNDGRIRACRLTRLSKILDYLADNICAPMLSEVIVWVQEEKAECRGGSESGTIGIAPKRVLRWDCNPCACAARILVSHPFRTERRKSGAPLAKTQFRKAPPSRDQFPHSPID